MSNGKGDTPRPLSVPQDEFARRWDATFGGGQIDGTMLTTDALMQSSQGSAELLAKLKEAEMLRYAAMRDAARFLRDDAA